MSTNTQKLQDKIYKKYGQEKVEAEVERVCTTCSHWYRASHRPIGSKSHCPRLLLPITSTGDPCPYYKERKETE